MAPTGREIYELVLEISQGVVRLENSVEDLLAEVRTFNNELSSDLRTLAKLRETEPQAST
jgi:hypothetical protein